MAGEDVEANGDGAGEKDVVHGFWKEQKCNVL